MRVGVIGLGAMGGGIARNLVKKGFSVVVRDLRSEAVEQLVKEGANAVESAAELAGLCDVVVASLPTSPVHPALEKEILGPQGILEGARPGNVIIDTGNTSPLVTRKIFGKCQEKGVFFLDAAVSGGTTGAYGGTLSTMVGGPREAYERVRPVIDAFSKRVIYLGASGSGQMAKLVNNIMVAVNIASISEALVLGTKAGLDPERLLEAVTGGAAQSWALDTYGKAWIGRAPGQKGVKEEFREKQVGWAVEIASELEVPLPVTVCVHELFKMARALGKHGHSEPILEMWEEMTGTFFSRSA